MGYLGAGVTRFNTADGLTVTGDADITGAITTDGMVTTGNVTFGDNDKAIFGGELQIYSDATHARIVENGTGQLKIQGNNMQLLTSDGAFTYLEGNASTSAVTLYHASNSPRLATTATGVDVTGTITSDGLTVGDGHQIGDETTYDNLVIKSSTDENMVLSAGGTGQFIYKTGSTTLDNGNEKMRIDNSGNVGIGTSSPASLLHLDQGSGGNGLRFERDSYDTMDIELSESGFRIRNETDGRTDLFIDGSGNVGIGTSSPVSISGYTNLTTNGTSGSFISLQTNGTENLRLFSGGSNEASIQYHSGGVLTFVDGTSGGTERMRIDSSGIVTIENKLDLNGQLDLDVAVATNPALSVTHTGTGNSTLAIFTQAASNTYNMAEWRDSSNTGVLYFAASGNITNTNNSYGAISDVKLKENIADAGSQWDDIKAVKVRKYSFKTESSETANQIGVVAQELEAAGMNGLVVDNIDRHPDTFEDLGTITKEVKYSVLYMKALKALQEAMTRIETLETNQAALEARIAALEAN